MRTIHHWKLADETWKEQQAAGRHNPATTITFRDQTGVHRYHIGTGNSDRITVFRESGVTYVLGVNYRMGYASLQVFAGDTVLGSVYVGGDDADKIDLDHSDMHLCKVLREYVDLLNSQTFAASGSTPELMDRCEKLYG